ncbi:hypothetical protein SAMN04244559_00892 [Magnetospirillum fulvum]|uniref:Glycosyltransferase RgtA/B/C/D-like domain-containing protein n=2 Tax=Magnetospirillum fulvum TaxID=1082 RepID=A0A1H6H3P4_MAGFU|nr:hypothetical protein SAMN04244559_00892 [Magnetospirillum fulvum]
MRNLSSLSPLRLDLGHVCLALVLCLFHALLYWKIAEFYAAHLPHYDSIGSYTQAFRVLRAYHQDGWGAAFELASKFHLSLTQAMFAALFAPLLDSTPQSLQLYNTLALAMLSFTLASTTRLLGGGKWSALAAGLLPLLPDGLYWWQSGWQDWQRDPAYIAFLASAAFLLLRHAALRTTTSGVLLGVAVGLTIISRDSAPGYVVMIIGPAYVVLAVTLLVRHRSEWRAIMIPVLTSLPFAALYAIFQLPGTLARFGNAYIFYGWNSGLQVSAAAHWAAPFKLLIGRWQAGQGLAGNQALVETAAVFGCLLVLGGLAFASRCLRFESMPGRRRLAVAAVTLGLWAVFVTMANLIVVVGLGNIGFESVKPMFFPTLLLFFALGVVALGCLRASPRTGRLAGPATLAFAVLLLAWAPHRLDLKGYDESASTMAALPKIMALLQEKPGAVVVFYWQDGITVDTLIYYSVQRGLQEPRTLYFTAPDGAGLDVNIGVLPNMAVTEIQDIMVRDTLCKADFVLLAADRTFYTHSDNPLFIRRHGGPIFDRLTAALKGKEAFSYNWWSYPLTLYDNRTRPPC